MNMTKKIELGDRIYARLSMHGRTVLEFMIDRVANMTELIGELRHMTYDSHGLAMLYDRNQSRGWSQERPLMLYSPNPVGKPAPAKTLWEDNPLKHHSPEMLFPWETH